MMADLVAGGAGFIGSHLCERLLGLGRRVICVDCLITGRLVNIQHLLSDPRFVFLEHDIATEGRFPRHTDRVFHLASPASPAAYLRYPVDTLRANSEGTHQLLRVAAGHGARFLYASSSEVYGDPEVHPQGETSPTKTDPVGPRSMYQEAKRFGEALTAAYSNSGGVDARIVRIFNTYGPRSDPDDARIVPSFVTQALSGRSLTVHGDGSQTRSLCFVSDLVEGLLRAMETPGTRGEVVNLGNPDEHTVLEYADVIRELTESDSPVRFVPHPAGDEPRRRRPDISKAKRLLGWQPEVPLREGLLRTIEYFRTEMRLPVRSGSRR